MTLEQNMVQTMAIFDKYAGSDGDCSSLSQPELIKLMKSEFPTLCKMENGDATLMKICKQLDLDGDKKVDFKEFGIFMISLTMVMRDVLHAKGCKK